MNRTNGTSPIAALISSKESAAICQRMTGRTPDEWKRVVTRRRASGRTAGKFTRARLFPLNDGDDTNINKALNRYLRDFSRFYGIEDGEMEITYAPATDVVNDLSRHDKTIALPHDCQWVPCMRITKAVGQA